jgi:MFS family permease
MTAIQPYSRTSPARAWIFISILFIASIVSVIDRAILNIVVDPVRANLGLTDVHIALLQGLAFGLFYAAVGLPLGLSADRYSRRGLIMLGMGLWSGATIAGGLAQSFGALFISRLAVGLGEAALAPAAISLIGDLFPPDKRGRPISIFLMGQALAIGLSISVAGSILQAAKAGRFHALPLLNGLAPWRVVFVCCGLLGLVVLALMLTTREPSRRTARESGNIGRQAAQCLAYLGRNKAIFIPFYLAFAFYFAAAYGAGAWAPTMLMRGFGATGGQLARGLGPLSLTFGVLGPLAGGALVDFYGRRKRPTAKLAILALAPLLALPSAFAVFAPSLSAAMVLAAVIGGMSALIGTVMFATLQSMVPPEMRGVAVALTGLINTVIGATLGPLLVAEFTQHLYRSPSLVGYSIATLAAPALVIASVCFYLSLAAFKRQAGSGGEVVALALADGPTKAEPALVQDAPGVTASI